MIATYSDLVDRTVFVSGGATGIGSDIVTALSRQGADVVFVDIDAAGAAQLLATLSDDPDASTPAFIECDVTDDEALRSALETAEARSGGVDVLINNAANDARHRVDEVDAGYWDRAVAVNLRHQFVAAQAIRPAMAGRGRGSIVNFGSVAPAARVPNLSVYNTCKAAVRGLTRSLAQEFGPDGIRVNTLIPGAILTPKQLELWYPDDAAVDAMVSRQCLPRRLGGSDVAEMVLFLASDVSAACTSQEFVVDGGLI